MTPDPMPEPAGPEDERFVYVVTAAGVEALREGAAGFDSEQAPTAVKRVQVQGSRGREQPSSIPE